MTADNSQLTVIVVTWNNEATIEACIQSISQSQDGLKKQIIVIDNASRDKTPELLKGEELMLITNQENRGFAAAVNQGLKLVESPYVMLLNPDARLNPDAIKLLVEELARREDIAVVGPQLINSDQSVQPSGRYLPSLKAVFAEVFYSEKQKKQKKYYRLIFGRSAFDEPAEVDEVSGACLVTRQEVIKRIGLFDERFFLYYEETDWFKRLKPAGLKVLYFPQAKIAHLWGHSMKQDKPDSDRQFYISQLYYWKKHHNWWSNWMLIKLMGLQGLLGWLKAVITFKPKSKKQHYLRLLSLTFNYWLKGRVS